jgi:hypothetical protein
MSSTGFALSPASGGLIHYARDEVDEMFHDRQSSVGAAMRQIQINPTLKDSFRNIHFLPIKY